ncbi:MAG: glycoside hydrolase family 3 C-terminal domain-containing protein, partial [Sedimentisphaerales bacterium]|nr:glycoside hydrolase family 3 C-terminal domain-containing protein [Sedimentisphaerales bacterium]
MLRKKAIAVSYLVGVFMLCLSFPCPARSDSRKPVYLDASKPVEERVEDLLARMTLEEKVGQLNMPCVYVHQLGKDIKTKMAACIEFARGTRIKGIGPGGGFFTLPNTILQEGTEQQATFLNRLQKIAREETRLGIPLLITEEGTHGLMCSGGTIFPEGPALGSTWNMRLLQKIYTVAAREARAIGVHQLFTLVVEPNRDPRLGRNQEGYSEDPYLCSRIAEVIVRAVQGDDIGQPDKVVAGLCHYPGQSQPVSGLERGAMEWSERILREAFLPPWEAGIRQAGALGVMATYPAINGVPVHASSAILRDLLRDELEFQGIVLGEGGGLSTLINEGLAPSQKIAGEMTIKAGVDVGISYEEAYLLPLIENVQEGKVSMDFIDRALRRVLRIKFRLGLFEKPYVDVVRAKRVVHTKESRDLALEAAHEGIVLLKNQNHLLPLDKNLKKVAVIGPNADNVLNQLGDYTSNKILQDVVTVLDGIRDKVSTASDVVHIKGCNVFNRDLNEIDRARQAAKEADVAVVVLGENAWKTKGDQITSGEGYDVASLDLTGLQEDLLKAVEATGTPTVLILINGRPLSIAWAAENVDAIVETWLSGEMGGAAIADVLFGDVNPSGRLPITIPRHVGQLPVYYNHKKSKTYWIEKGWGKPYADMSPEPLYAFGHGLSYTTFGYSALRIEPKAIPPEETVTVTVDVKNTGKRAGSEVMQCYIQDVISSVTTPSLELKGFQKVSLVPGETKTVRFVLGPDHLSLLDRHLKRVVEPGEFKVMIGHSSKDIRLDGSFNVTLEAIPETTAKIDQKRMPYLDPGRPIDQRVEDLLSRMTLPEKVGQMNIPCTYKKRIGWGLNEKDVSMHTTLSPDVRARQIEGCKKFTAGSLAEGLGPGGGFFTLCDRLVYEGTRKQAELLNELQRIAKAETRLKIPLLQIEEGTHGLMCSGATIFPEGLSLGSTWNLTLVQAVYEAAAREGRAIGVHGLCTLVVESIRDPRLGRNEEAFSECPFLCSQIAESIVRALQGEDIRAADKLAAFLCHYPGQSEPVSGLERGAMHVSTRKLHEVFLPPWVAGIKRCGALGAMATYPAIDGVPVHGSYEILTELLREELGFKGVLLSEGRGISTLIDECMVDNQKEAGQI